MQYDGLNVGMALGVCDQEWQSMGFVCDQKRYFWSSFL
jgi:hypothetical protein